MAKMARFLVKKCKKLVAKIINKLNKKRKLPSVNFKIGKVQHRLYAEKKGRSVQVMVASSKGKPIEKVDAATKAEAKKMKGDEAKKLANNISTAAATANKETGVVEKKVDLESKKKTRSIILKKYRRWKQRVPRILKV